MIEGIRSIDMPTLPQATEVKSRTSDELFTTVLEKAKGLINETKQAESHATQLTYDFISGKTDNIHSLMIAQEKSGILLQFTMQVRNQLLESYREIMRMPV